MDTNTISFGEIEKLKNRITSVIFPVNNFNLESILRWLMDRKLTTYNFYEESGNYIFIQTSRDNYTTFKTKRLDGEDIWIEIGSK